MMLFYALMMLMMMFLSVKYVFTFEVVTEVISATESLCNCCRGLVPEKRYHHFIRVVFRVFEVWVPI